MELELEISESEDYSEFPAEETVEQRPLCYNCKRNNCRIVCEERREGHSNSLQESVEKRERENYQIYVTWVPDSVTWVQPL